MLDSKHVRIGAIVTSIAIVSIIGSSAPAKPPQIRFLRNWSTAQQLELERNAPVCFRAGESGPLGVADMNLRGPALITHVGAMFLVDGAPDFMLDTDGSILADVYIFEVVGQNLRLRWAFPDRRANIVAQQGGAYWWIGTDLNLMIPDAGHGETFFFGVRPILRSRESGQTRVLLDSTIQRGWQTTFCTDFTRDGECRGYTVFTSLELAFGLVLHEPL